MTHIPRGGAWQDYIGPFDVTEERQHTIEYASTEAAGNTETVRSAEFGADPGTPGLVHHGAGRLGG